ncbi:MAG: CRTAC1 family protein [Acidobacteriota bacterium]
MDHPYFGTAAVDRLRSELANLDREPQRADAVLRLARRLIQEGDPEGAIAELRTLIEGPEKLSTDRRIELWDATALAHLQAAEDENCLLHHSGSSCILPLDAAARHRRPQHARRAGDALERLAEEQPKRARHAWLLNVARLLADDFPAGVPENHRLKSSPWIAEPSPLRWPNRAHDLGVGVRDLAGGAVMDDFDGDGRLDLMTSTWDPCGPLRAFRAKGDGGFEDVTEAWGLSEQLGGLNLVHADADNDGRLDVLVLRGGWLREHGRIRNSLLINRLGEAGAGAFVDVTAEAGLAYPASPTQTAAWADADGDGDLDLYIGNETTESEPQGSQLMRNDSADGRVRFVDITEPSGVANGRYAKGVTWGDFDDDGDPDLYVSNVGANRLYRNDGPAGGEIRFTDVAAAVGVEGPPGYSFATWFFDVDNDGDLDLFVADYNASTEEVVRHYLGRGGSESGHPVLYRNDGGTFRDISAQVGLRRPLTPMGANFGDVDNDGWLDVYLGTGDPELESLVPNVLYRNLGGALLKEATAELGLGHLQKGHGVAFGDVDGDGDQDLLHQLGGFFAGDDFSNALFENPGAAGDWVTLRLRGVDANRFGVGARVAITVRRGGSRRTVHRLVGSGGSFGGSSLQLEAGLGKADSVERIEIRWPGSGTVQRLGPLPPNRVYDITESAGGSTPDP